MAATLAKALQGGGPYPLAGYGRYFAPCIGTAQSNGYAGAKEENKQPNILRTPDSGRALHEQFSAERAQPKGLCRAFVACANKHKDLG